MDGAKREGNDRGFPATGEDLLSSVREDSPGRRPDSVVKGRAREQKAITPAQRIVLLDVWQRSGLGAPEFSAMVGVTAHTLYEWKRRFERDGPAGLMDGKRGPRSGSRLPDATQRAILLVKAQHRLALDGDRAGDGPAGRRSSDRSG
jgi:hypothetical protein